MSDYIFAPRAVPSLPIVGADQRYAVGRIFCVGKNYVAHAAEMGGEVDREAPWYFTKSCHALCQSGQTVPYPPGTSNFHYEMELVVTLGRSVFEADLQQAADDGAVIGAITPQDDFGALADQRICLTVNDSIKQDATLTDMVWSVPEVISHLSRYYHLGPGDVIMTGTPAGVGPVVVGDTMRAEIDGLQAVTHYLT